MAFPGTPSTTAGTILGSTITSFYEKTMLEWMRPEFRFYTFASKKPIPQNGGTAIVFNRKVALNYGYMLSQGYPQSAIKTLSTNQVSALLEEIGDSVNVSKYARLTSVIDTDAYAMEVLADQAAHTVDQYVIQAIIADSGVNHYVKRDSAITQGSYTAVVSGSSSARLALSDLRAAATNLQRKNVKPYEGGSYVGIFHPYQLSDIMGDSNFKGWAAYQDPQKMYKFEVGEAMGIRCMRSSKVPIAPGSAYSGDSVSTATGSAAKVYGGVIFGQDAYAVTEIDGGVNFYKNTGASKTDPNNRVDNYAWDTTIASKVLNPSAIEIVWSGQSEIFRPGGIGGGPVLSDIAASEVNVLFPSTTASYYFNILTSW